MIETEEIDPQTGAVSSPGWRLLIPAVLGLAGVVLMAAPSFTPAPIVPHFALLIVGTWAYYLPRLMPPALAFLLGLANDFVLGLPPGVNATLLPLTAYLLTDAAPRGDPRPILVDWLLAGGLILSYLFLRTELVAIGGAPRPQAWLVPQWLTSWALVPAVTRFSALLYGKVIAAQ